MGLRLRWPAGQAPTYEAHVEIGPGAFGFPWLKSLGFALLKPPDGVRPPHDLSPN